MEHMDSGPTSGQAHSGGGPMAQWPQLPRGRASSNERDAIIIIILILSILEDVTFVAFTQTTQTTVRDLNTTPS